MNKGMTTEKSICYYKAIRPGANGDASWECYLKVNGEAYEVITRWGSVNKKKQSKTLDSFTDALNAARKVRELIDKKINSGKNYRTVEEIENVREYLTSLDNAAKSEENSLRKTEIVKDLDKPFVNTAPAVNNNMMNWM